MRQVAIGAVVAFVLTVIALSVWKPTAGEVTPASPPAQQQQPVPMPAPVPANMRRAFVAPPPVLPVRARGDMNGVPTARPLPVMRDNSLALPSAYAIDAGTP
ncbi:MAG: hypothetical protein ACO1OB_11265 [Archangium sp.]